jgi:hypothetical protein
VVNASEEHRRRASDIAFSTACWRRYIATWEIKEGRFYLVAIEGQFEFIGSEPLFANWFSGDIRIPMGEVIVYRHMGFESVFAEEMFIAIERGVVVSRRQVDNRKR